MRFQELAEAKLLGNPNISDIIDLFISDNGDTMILMPNDGSPFSTYGRLKFKFNSSGVEFMQNLVSETPTKIEWPGSSYEKTVIDGDSFKDLVKAHMEDILAYLEPVKTAEDLGSEELFAFYKDSLLNQEESLANSLRQTAQYSQDFKNFNIEVGITCLQYLQINNATKTISIVNNTKRNASRMGNYKGKETQYILIDSDFSISNTRVLAKILKQLVNTYNFFKEYNFIDSRKGNENPIPIKDILANNSELNQFDKVVNTMLTQTVGTIYAYHGTSRAILKQIVRDKAMIPGKGPEYHDKIKGHSENLIYMSLDIEQVRRYAVRAAGGNPAVVLKIEINDLTKLRFDEDSIIDSLFKIPNKIFPNFVKMVSQAFDQPNIWEQASALMTESGLTKGVKQSIIYNWVAYPLRHNLNGLTNLSRQQQLIFSYINGLAIKTASSSGVSFGYAGRIPLNKIKIVEEFKSQRYRDPADYNKYDSMYDQMKATQTFPNKGADE